MTFSKYYDSGILLSDFQKITGQMASKSFVKCYFWKIYLRYDEWKITQISQSSVISLKGGEIICDKSA